MDLPTHPPVIVFPPVYGDPPFRRIEILRRPVGRAFTLAHVVEFARRAGLEDLDPRDPEQVGWHRGGPDVWG
ncbi:hypothetical protein ABIA33_001397 [Streptacidiphilus sp. MAP12-16]|uniref:hypothetical protein n=1 Tax=Streptacidiphilus sp. MAP12-16 TaxID=3156300 RepID=UPI0035127E1B